MRVVNNARRTRQIHTVVDVVACHIQQNMCALRSFDVVVDSNVAFALYTFILVADIDISCKKKGCWKDTDSSSQSDSQAMSQLRNLSAIKTSSSNEI